MQKSFFEIAQNCLTIVHIILQNHLDTGVSVIRQNAPLPVFLVDLAAQDMVYGFDCFSTDLRPARAKGTHIYATWQQRGRMSCRNVFQMASVVLRWGNS